MLYDYVHISHGVSKLGADIPSVSLPVGVTCRADAPCFKKCYARRGRFCFQRNRAYLETNLALWRKDPEFFEREVTIAAYPARFFRWHSSGDKNGVERTSVQLTIGNIDFCNTKKNNEPASDAPQVPPQAPPEDDDELPF